MNRYLLLLGLIICMVLVGGCNNPFAGCTKDAKICPDGTSVGRNQWKGCAFDPCPKVYTCEQDSDCVIGDYAGQCCGCPFAVHKDQIDNKKTFVHGSEEYRALPRPEGCEGVMCEPCPELDWYDVKCADEPIRTCRFELKEN